MGLRVLAVLSIFLLEQLTFSQDWGDSRRAMINLITHLNNSQKFPARKYIVVIDEYDEKLQEICFRRNIVLRTKGDDEDHIQDFTSW